MNDTDVPELRQALEERNQIDERIRNDARIPFDSYADFNHRTSTTIVVERDA